MSLKAVPRLAVAAGIAALVGFTPGAARAQVATCNAQIAFDYFTAQPVQAIGDVVTVRLTLSTASITGGTKVTINRLRFDLDCDSGSPLGLGCVDDGAIIRYQGDATINTNCTDMPGGSAVSWSSNVAAGGSATNEVVFTPSTGIMIPASQTDYCFLEFDVQVLSQSTDPTPTTIEEVAGYSVQTSDAVCDNGLASSGSQSGSLAVCPVCDDGNACTTETCNQTNGSCQTTSTTTCDDQNACTTESCNTTTGACQTTSTVTCTDGNACTTESCNTTTGACQTTSTTTCNDQNACTTESCNTTTGACQTTSTVTCNDQNACTTESCNTTTGACQTTSTTTCNDQNACTTESCNTSTGACQTTSTVTCADPACEVCNPSTGACEQQSPLPPECAPEICRTPGFWATHADQDPKKKCSQNITQAVIDANGGLDVCGTTITNTDVGNAQSALEGMCVPVRGDKRLQLIRQLIAASLNCVVSGGLGSCSVGDVIDDCNAACTGGPSDRSVTECIGELDCFNNGGSFDDQTGGCTAGGPGNCHEQALPLGDFDLPNNDPGAGQCFGQQGAAGSSDECQQANASTCTVLSCN
jgi:hypothetical protein